MGEMNTRGAGQKICWPTTRVTLLDRIRSTEDQTAWSAFVDLYSPVVYCYGRNRGLQHDDAQNVTQEVFYCVFRSMRNFKYDPQRGSFRNWLGLITHQQVISNLGKQKRRCITNFAEAETSTAFVGEAEGAWIEAFNSQIYRAAIATIRSKFDTESWRAFERVWDEGERPGVVARDLSRDPKWMYQLKFQVIELLRSEIERLASDVAFLHRS